MHTHCVRKLFEHALMDDCVEMKRSLQHRGLSFEGKNDTHTRSLTHTLFLSLSLYLGGQSNSIAPPTAAHRRVNSEQDTHTHTLEHTLWDTTQHRVMLHSVCHSECVCACLAQRERVCVCVLLCIQTKQDTHKQSLSFRVCVRVCTLSLRVCSCVSCSERVCVRVLLCIRTKHRVVLHSVIQSVCVRVYTLSFRECVCVSCSERECVRVCVLLCIQTKQDTRTYTLSLSECKARHTHSLSL